MRHFTGESTDEPRLIREDGEGLRRSGLGKHNVSEDVLNL